MRPESQGPELVIGLVGATGTDLEFVSLQIQHALASLGYDSKVIRVVHLLRSFEEWAHLESAPEDTRILAHMDAGDAFRSRTRYADGLARLAILAIEEYRQTITGSLSKPATRVGFILRSLKRREEVETLRSVYGDSFILVGAYSPRSARVGRLATRIAESHSATTSEGFRSIAETLVNRDLDDEGKDSGQRVSEVFPLSDFFVNANDVAGVSAAITRAASLVFGYQYSTPTRDECGMFFAQAAALRSGSLARQVGAAICSADGDVVAVGTNEVPKAGGGSYWEGDANDQRDHVWGADASDRKKRIIATQVLERLKAAGWLSHPYDTTSSQELGDRLLEIGLSSKKEDPSD